jgi:hypothetical protein
MSEYTPDNWVVLKIGVNPDDIIYKVLAGWSGGYTTGDSWKLNSGIVKTEVDGNYYRFIGYSGSVYVCHKESECLRMNNSHIYNQLKERYGDAIERVNVLEDGSYESKRDSK